MKLTRAFAYATISSASYVSHRLLFSADKCTKDENKFELICGWS